MIGIDIREYWTSWTLDEQMSLRRSVDVCGGHGNVPVWQVRGIIVVSDVVYCGCEFCEGHPESGEHLNVDVIVSCRFDEARDFALDRVCRDEGYDCWDGLRWSDGPFIDEVTAFGNTEADIEQYRRSLGY